MSPCYAWVQRIVPDVLWYLASTSSGSLTSVFGVKRPTFMSRSIFSCFALLPIIVIIVHYSEDLMCLLRVYGVSLFNRDLPVRSFSTPPVHRRRCSSIDVTSEFDGMWTI